MPWTPGSAGKALKPEDTTELQARSSNAPACVRKRKTAPAIQPELHQFPRFDLCLLLQL